MKDLTRIEAVEKFNKDFSKDKIKRFSRNYNILFFLFIALIIFMSVDLFLTYENSPEVEVLLEGIIILLFLIILYLSIFLYAFIALLLGVARILIELFSITQKAKMKGGRHGTT